MTAHFIGKGGGASDAHCDGSEPPADITQNKRIRLISRSNSAKAPITERKTLEIGVSSLAKVTGA